MKIDYVIDPSIARANHSALIKAAENSRQILARILPQIQTRRREGDTNEYRAIMNATEHGQLNTVTYVKAQRDDRRQYRIPDDQLNMLITDKALFYSLPSGGRRNMFGVTYMPLHESIASISNYLTTGKKAARGLTHTVLHESGHLMGIENECNRRNCSMNDTEATNFLTGVLHGAALRHLGTYCAHCLAQINR